MGRGSSDPLDVLANLRGGACASCEGRILLEKSKARVITHERRMPELGSRFRKCGSSKGALWSTGPGSRSSTRASLSSRSGALGSCDSCLGGTVGFSIKAEERVIVSESSIPFGFRLVRLDMKFVEGGGAAADFGGGGCAGRLVCKGKGCFFGTLSTLSRVILRLSTPDVSRSCLLWSERNTHWVRVSLAPTRRALVFSASATQAGRRHRLLAEPAAARSVALGQPASVPPPVSRICWTPSSSLQSCTATAKWDAFCLCVCTRLHLWLGYELWGYASYSIMRRRGVKTNAQKAGGDRIAFPPANLHHASLSCIHPFALPLSRFFLLVWFRQARFVLFAVSCVHSLT